MRKIVLISLVLIFSAACKKATAPAVHDGIVGKWKMSEYLADPGDGSGTWQPASQSNPHYLEFKDDGSLLAIPAGVNDFDHYELTSDSTLVFKKASEDYKRWYVLTETSLTITGGCFEPCGTRYVPAQ